MNLDCTHIREFVEGVEVGESSSPFPFHNTRTEYIEFGARGMQSREHRQKKATSIALTPGEGKNSRRLHVRF